MIISQRIEEHLHDLLVCHPLRLGVDDRSTPASAVAGKGHPIHIDALGQQLLTDRLKLVIRDDLPVWIATDWVIVKVMLSDWLWCPTGKPIFTQRPVVTGALQSGSEEFNPAPTCG